MSLSDKTILLVEDDANDVLLLQRALRKNEVRSPVQVVSDGELATHYLSGEGPFQDREKFPFPALVLLDLKLPRKNGLEVLQWARSCSGPVRRLPIIILSSSRQPIDINRAYDLGANSYLVKPGQFDGLLNLVRHLHDYWGRLNQLPELHP